MAVTEARVLEIVQAALVTHAATVESQVGSILAGVKQELSSEINTQIARAAELSAQLKSEGENVKEATRIAHARVDQQVNEVNLLRVQLGEKFDEFDAKHTDLVARLIAFDAQVEAQRKKSGDELTAAFNTMTSLL